MRADGMEDYWAKLSAENPGMDNSVSWDFFLFGSLNVS
jgi:hypothetical protein